DTSHAGFVSGFMFERAAREAQRRSTFVRLGTRDLRPGCRRHDLWRWTGDPTQCSGGTLGLLPNLPERAGDPVGFRLMRGIEVMESLKYLSREVRKEAAEPLLHSGPPRMSS